MSDSRPVYLFSPEEDGLPPFPEELAALATSAFPLSLAAVRPPSPSGEADSGRVEAGWILLHPDLDSRHLMVLAEAMGDTREPWTLLLPVGGEGGFRLLSLSPGYTEGVERIVERLSAPGLGPALLSFRLTLGALARIRHDINNPLTAALAEAQLLLMDAQPGTEMEESLRVVEDQLRRIRDMVAELTPLRIPRG